MSGHGAGGGGGVKMLAVSLYEIGDCLLQWGAPAPAVVVSAVAAVAAVTATPNMAPGGGLISVPNGCVSEHYLMLVSRAFDDKVHPKRCATAPHTREQGSFHGVQPRASLLQGTSKCPQTEREEMPSD